jgi:hypothetical protein
MTEPGGDLGSHARHVKGCQRVVDLNDGARIFRSWFGMSRVVGRTSMTEPGGDLGSHARHVKGFS